MAIKLEHISIACPNFSTQISYILSRMSTNNENNSKQNFFDGSGLEFKIV